MSSRSERTKPRRKRASRQLGKATTVVPSDVRNGMILWLPKKGDLVQPPPIDDWWFDHPLVVISPNSENQVSGQIVVLMVSPSDGTLTLFSFSMLVEFICPCTAKEKPGFQVLTQSKGDLARRNIARRKAPQPQASLSTDRPLRATP
jgi:hypothetical protein